MGFKNGIHLILHKTRFSRRLISLLCLILSIASFVQCNKIEETYVNKKLELVWEYDMGGDRFASSIQCLNGNIYYILNEEQQMVCLEVETRKQIWKKTFEYPVYNITFFDNTKILTYVILWENEKSSSDLICLDSLTGKTLWTKRLNGFTIDEIKIHKDRVFVHGCSEQPDCFRGHLFCYNSKNFDELWSIKADFGAYIFDCIDDMIFVGSEYTKNIKCLSSLSGKTLWEHKFDYYIQGMPLTNANEIFCISEEKKMYVLDKLTGNLKTVVKVGEILDSNLELIDGLILGSIHRNGIYCIDSKDGNIVWSFKDLQTSIGSITIHKGLVYFCTFDGQLYRINLKDGNVFDKYDLGSNAISGVVIFNEKVFVKRNYNKLLCFE